MMQRPPLPREMYGPSPWMPPSWRRQREMPAPSSWAMMQRRRELNGPSPWVPGTILGVILIIAVMPYVSLPQLTQPPPPVVYQKSSSFPLPLLLVPVVLFILAQWLSGSQWRPGFRPGIDNRSFGRVYSWGSSWGNRSFVPPGAKPRMMPWPQQPQTGWRPWSRAPPSGPAGYGYRDPNNRYSANNQNWTSSIWRSFMDYSGHWLLILLGFALFAIVSSG